jgi:hypothetical protein
MSKRYGAASKRYGKCKKRTVGRRRGVKRATKRGGLPKWLTNCWPGQSCRQTEPEVPPTTGPVPVVGGPPPTPMPSQSPPPPPPSQSPPQYTRRSRTTSAAVSPPSRPQYIELLVGSWTSVGVTMARLRKKVPAGDGAVIGTVNKFFELQTRYKTIMEDTANTETRRAADRLWHELMDFNNEVIALIRKYTTSPP